MGVLLGDALGLDVGSSLLGDALGLGVGSSVGSSLGGIVGEGVGSCVAGIPVVVGGVLGVDGLSLGRPDNFVGLLLGCPDSNWSLRSFCCCPSTYSISSIIRVVGNNAIRMELLEVSFSPK